MKAFVARGLFERHGVFDESFRICMDYEFWLRVGRDRPPCILPFTVSNMRAGGISYRFRDTYFEQCRARRMHAPRPFDGVRDVARFAWLALGRAAGHCLPAGLYGSLQACKNALCPVSRRRRAQRERVVRMEESESQSDSQS